MTVVQERPDLPHDGMALHGKPDLAVANTDEDMVSVLLGHGDRAFTAKGHGLAALRGRGTGPER